MDQTRIVGVRMRPDELAKLDRLARATERDRSKVLRLLVAQAELAESPDVRLGESEVRDG